MGIALAAVVHAAPASAQAIGNDAGLPGDGGVLVVGDSLEVLTKPYLRRHLPGIPLTHNAVGGYASPAIFDLFKESYDPSQSVIVFDAGTNDNPNYPQILAGNLEAVSRRIGARCMVVPTIHGLTVGGVGNQGKNRIVRAFAASRPGTTTPDWARVVATRPDLMQPDDLHPTPEGADHRAEVIAEGVQACLEGIPSAGGSRGLSAAERRVDQAIERRDSIALQAEAASTRAERAADETREIRGALVARREDAAAKVAALEADHARELADHDRRTDTAIGLAIGLLALALIALAWPAMRTSPPVQWLAGQSILVAVPAILVAMLTPGIAAAVLIGRQGWSRTAGVALAITTVGLGLASLAARHSVRVERGERSALLGRAGPRRWTRFAVCALVGALAGGVGGYGLTRTEPEPPAISAELRQAAEYSRGDPASPPTAELVKARTKSDALLVRSRRLNAKLRAARVEVDLAQRRFASSSRGD